MKIVNNESVTVANDSVQRFETWMVDEYIFTTFTEKWKELKYNRQKGKDSKEVRFKNVYRHSQQRERNIRKRISETNMLKVARQNEIWTSITI